MEQLTQEANGDTQLYAHIITHQSQGPLNRKAEEPGKYTLSQVSCFDLILGRQVRSSRNCEQEQQ
jgi:hypothetical protein